MQPFTIHILGCGSALPTLRHCASAQIVDVRGKMFLVDCGEGTQVSLRRSKIRFTQISCVFISHLHGDHCFGLIGMISTFGLLGRTAPLHIYAPKELEGMLKMQMDFHCQGLDYEVVFHAVDTEKNAVVYEDRSLTIESIPLNHKIPCCGYFFKEKEGNRHINREMVDFYNIPVSQLNNIRAGTDWVTNDGETIENERLTKPADPIRSYAYCSDTRYMPDLHKIVKGATVLYHESTYLEDRKGNAKMYYHSTAEEAATVARDAGVGTLLLGHYSQRYDNDELFRDEASKVFKNTVLSYEGMHFSVK